MPQTLYKGDESLAQEANIKKKHHINTANIIKNQLEKLNIQVDKLKEKLPILERKINEKSIGSIDTSTEKNMVLRYLVWFNRGA